MKYLLKIFLIIFLCIILTPRALSSQSDDISYKVTDVRSLLDSCKNDFIAGDYLSALSNGYEFMNLVRNLPVGSVSNGDIATGLMYLGNVNYAFGNYKSAIGYYEQSLKYLHTKKEYEIAKKIYHNLTIVSSLTKDKTRAKKYISLLDKIPYRKNPEEEIYGRMLRVAVFEKNFGDLDRAIAMMKKARKFMVEKHLDSKLALTPVSEVYEMYEEIGQLDSAMVYLNEYYQLACEHNSSNMIVDANAGYMRLYAKMGDLKKSIEYQDRYFSAKDSLLNSSSFVDLNRLHNEETLRISDLKIQNLEIRLSRLTVMTWCFAILIVIVILLLLYLSQRSRLRQAYKALYKRNQEIINILDQNEIESSSIIPITVHEPEDEQMPDYENDDELCSKERMNENVSKEIVEKLKNVMNKSKEYLDPDFTISVLSSLVGYNTKYVSSVINDHYGKNFRSFINTYRIKEALIRLQSKGEYKNMTIKAIGESVGFRSTSNFISAFKKETGLTPSMYLKLSDEEK